MLADVLGVLVSLVLALLVAFVLGGLLKRRPGAFYGVAAVVVVVYLLCVYRVGYVAALQPFTEPLRKGYLATFLLALVMFTGTMPERSAVRRRLQPIRAELSILSFVLYMGHVLTFLPSYLPRLGMLVSIGNLMSASIVVALVLTGIYALLSALSLREVRARMPYGVWKGIQRLSYVMVGLLYLHICLAVGRSAMRGAAADMRVAVVLYTVLVVVYGVLRVRKALVDHRRRAVGSAAAGAAATAKTDPLCTPQLSK